MLAQVLQYAEPRTLSRVEYDRLAELGFFTGERVELIHGIVIKMSPIGPTHADLVDRLNERFVPALLKRARVRIQQPFLAHDQSEPEPDVALVPRGPYAKAHPDQAFLIVEVAESSLEYDRKTKAPLYAASSVPELWIVDVAAQAVEVYAKPKDGIYTSIERFAGAQGVSPQAFSDIVFRVADLFSSADY